jgi:lysophospholipase L1-like esterase
MRKIFPIVILALLVPLAVEGLLRLLTDEPEFASEWVFHPVLGHTGARSREITVGDVKSFYNEMGFRSDWLETPPPTPEKFSLLVLGDSMTEQSDMPRELIYPSLLRDALSAVLPLRLHTFASADYGTAEAFLSLHLYGPRVEPDLVVLQFLGLNDFVNNTLPLANRNKSWSDFSRPYLAGNSGKVPSFTVDGLDFVHAYPWRHWLTTHSRTFHLLTALRTIKLWDDWAQNGIPYTPCATELRLFLADPGAEWEEGLAATATLLQALRRKAGEAKTVGVYFPSNVELDDGLWSQGIEPELQRCFPGEAYSRRQGEGRFLALAGAAGFELVSLWEAMEEAAPGDRRDETLFIPGGHFSAKGHEVVGRALAERLLPMLR